MNSKSKKEFMSLYGKVHARFERFCKARAYGHVDYKDLMHDTVLVAIEKFDSIQDKHAFLPYLFNTCTKILANQQRKKREEKWSESYDQISSNRNDAESQLEVKDLYKALSQLPENSAEALILFEISGFSIREISVIQEASENTVKQRLFRGRKDLAVLLTDVPQAQLQEK